MKRILIENAAFIATCAGGELPRRGSGMNDIGAIENGYVLIDADAGTILEVGSGRYKHENVSTGADIDGAGVETTIIDAANCTVMPGFVDSHTHPVYAGSRAGEFYMRAQGRTYLEIAASGGGINASVQTTRDATREELLATGKRNAFEMLRHGTTTFEAKSGYGLSFESEIAMLEAIGELGRIIPQTVIPTFLGAHAIPPEYTAKRAEYVALVCGKMLDEIVERGLAKYVDVFIEEGAFTREEGRVVCMEARKRGLGIRIHADEFTDKGGAGLGVEMGAASVDHLGAIGADGIDALARGDTIATLMPATIFFVGSEGFAPARKLIDSGAPVALATDLNPGSSMVYGMPLTMTLAVLKMRMTLEECIVAATINAAFSLNLAGRKGSLERGKDADVIIIDAPHPGELPYRMGADLIRDVIVGGRIVKRDFVLTQSQAE